MRPRDIFKCPKCDSVGPFTRKKVKLEGVATYKCNKCGQVGILVKTEMWEKINCRSAISPVKFEDVSI